MAKGEERSDFYQVLGLDNNCSSSQLRIAYKKLALRWHPDRCTASGNSEEAKKKFQVIQQAYSVLSDDNKRFLYDLGVYDKDDDDENDMGDFLGEMVVMMSQTKPSEGGQQSFEDLQNLFQEMLENDGKFYSPVSQSSTLNNTTNNIFSCSYNDSNKKNCSSMSSEKTKVDFDMESLDLHNFCIGTEGDTLKSNSKGRGGTGRQTGPGRKQKVSSRRDMPSHDAKILA